MDEACAMDAETTENNDTNNSSSSTQQDESENTNKLDRQHSLQSQQEQDDLLVEKSDDAHDHEATNSPKLNNDCKSSSRDETKVEEKMNVDKGDTDKSDVKGDENRPTSSSVTKPSSSDAEESLSGVLEDSYPSIEHQHLDSSDVKSPSKNEESSHSNSDELVTKSVASPDEIEISEEQKEKTDNQDACENEVKEAQDDTPKTAKSPDQAARRSNSISEVEDDDIIEQEEPKKTETEPRTDSALSMSASQEQSLLAESSDDDAQDVSIDLELSNAADEDQEGSDGEIQEVHDVEEEMEGQEGAKKSVDGDHQNMDVVTSGEVNFPIQPLAIPDLMRKLSSLQAELEGTQRKLAKAEKKLSRTKRHKESSESYNYDLRKRVKHLKKELHRYKKDSKKTFAEVGCQTTPESTTAEDPEGQDDVIEIPSTSAAGNGSTPRFWGGVEGGDEHQTLADSLKATAEAALSNSGYVLDPNSGLYYDYSTGYYYDPNNHLYYDPSTGVYYFYDQRSRSYQFHSQVDVDPSGMIPHGGWEGGRPRRGKKRRDRKQRREASDRDDMECEVIDIPDDDSPESKRPRKGKRKQKSKSSPGKAPHTATSPGDERPETEDPQIPSEGEMDDPESAGSTKEKSSRKKSSRKSPRKRSSGEKTSKTDKQGTDEKTVDESSTAKQGPEGDKNEADAVKEKGDAQKSADVEATEGKDKEATQKDDSNQEKVTKDKIQKDDAEPSTSDPKSSSSSPQPGTSQGETKSDGEEDKAAKSDSDKTTPDDSPQHPISNKKDAENETEEEEGEVDDDEIMEVESKRKDDIEEITILDSDSDDSDMEEGELSDSSMEDVSSSDDSSDGESDVVPEHVVPVRQDFPPCIRMIVTRSDKIQLGSLFVVTFTGGTIGREGSSHIVTIPELGVSKQHADIKYNEISKQYCITDLGSQNGTLINGKMLSKARSVSDPHPLSHKDYLTVGSTTLRVHIHPGDDTCDECEPGQVQALIAQLNPDNNQVTYALVSQADKEQMRRKELRKMKKKYNLAKDNYRQQDPSTSNAAYADRAGVRRQTVGSDNPYQPDDAPASVDRAIGESNVGRKMLEKMGWKEGKGLGKKDAGIKEPIQVLVHSKKSGLGTSMGVSMDQAQYMTNKRKNDRWQKAKARFDKLQHQHGEQPSSSAAPSNVQWVKGGTVTDKNGLYDEEDDIQECIEILSPAGSDEAPMDDAIAVSASSNAEATETMSISSTSGSDGVSTVDKSATTTAAGSNLSTTESRPKIQMKILGKRGKEQLPTSSVVLDDDDEEEEEMEVCKTNDKTNSSSSPTEKDTNGKGAAQTDDNDVGDSGEVASKESDKTVEADDTVLTSTAADIDNTTNSGGTAVESQGTVKEVDSGSTAKEASARSKWVTVGDGSNDSNHAGDGDASQQQGEAEDEAVESAARGNESDKPDSQTGSQSQTRTTGKKGKKNAKQTSPDTGPGSKTKKTDSSSQNDSQSPTRGRKRRTRQTAKSKEDMFADL